MCNTFCIVEERNNKEQILGLLLSLEVKMPSINCVISCREETKQFINNFPKKLDLKLDFIPYIRRFDEFDCIAYIQNILNSIKYGINKYGEVVYVTHTLIMVNKIIIDNNIREQGFGYIKKEDCDSDPEKKYMDFNFEIIYLRELSVLHEMIKYINESFIECENIIDYEDYEYDVEKQKEYIDFYRKLPYNMSHKEDMIFFDREILLASEDFFTFKNELTITDIKEDFICKERTISFLNIRFTDTFPPIQNVNKQILSYLPRHGIYYMSIANLKFSKDKIQFVIPNEKGIGIWDRTKESNYLNELINLTIEEYSDYFTKVNVNLDYYSCNNYLLFDKPNYIWLNNSVKKYTSVELYNYDNTLKDKLNENELKNHMGSYIGLYPKVLFDFLKERTLCENKKEVYELNKIPSTSEEYKVVLNLLNNFTFCKFNEFNVQMIASALALGVIPIVDYKYELHGLEKNVHYIDTLVDVNDVDKYSIVDNINTNKLIIRSCKEFVVNLLDNIFVR